MDWRRFFCCFIHFREKKKCREFFFSRMQQLLNGEKNLKAAFIITMGSSKSLAPDLSLPTPPKSRKLEPPTHPSYLSFPKLISVLSVRLSRVSCIQTVIHFCRLQRQLHFSTLPPRLLEEERWNNYGDLLSSHHEGKEEELKFLESNFPSIDLFDLSSSSSSSSLLLLLVAVLIS